MQKSISSLASKALNSRTIILSKCAICNTKKAILINKQEAKGFLKENYRKFKKKKSILKSKDNIWSADLTDMQLISKFNKGFTFLLCVIDISSKYACVVPLKDKKMCEYC